MPALRGVEERLLHLVAAAEAQLAHQAEIGDLGGVRDEAEDRVRQVVVDRLPDLVGQTGAERLALAVDVGVVAARKINALERALRLGQRGA